jgi:hypothetical protein
MHANYLRRIEAQREVACGSTDFSLCAFLSAKRKSKPHRLKPVLLDRTRIPVRNVVQSSFALGSSQIIWDDI